MQLLSPNIKCFSIVSSFNKDCTSDNNRMAHESIKANLRNLNYVFVELKCHYRCPPKIAKLNEEYTLLVPNANLYDIMLLGEKYYQKAVINKDGSTINIMDAEVGRILSSIKYDEGDIKKWVAFYTEYLMHKYCIDSKIEIVSIEKLQVPTRTDSLLSYKNKEGLAATRWVSIYDI